jgi:hypothetical protein
MQKRTEHLRGEPQQHTAIRSRSETMSSDKGPPKKKLAELTAAEERAMEKAMDFYRYTGKSEAEANRSAWADIQKEFPRLRDFESPESK